MYEDSDLLLTCPNNPAHQVASSRMQFHLVKCNHVATKLPAVCRFNAAHQVPVMELAAHEKACCDRKIIEKDLIYTVEGNRSVIAAYQAPILPPQEEEWDSDDAPTYNPDLNILSKPILRSLQGATKAERKTHRLNERGRMQNINSSDPQLPPKQAAEEPMLAAYDYTKALRAPASKSKTFNVPSQPDMQGLGMGRGRVLPQDLPGAGRGRGAIPKNGHGALPNTGKGAVPKTGQGAIPKTGRNNGSAPGASGDFNGEKSYRGRGVARTRDGL